MIKQREVTNSTNLYKTQATTNFILSLQQKFSMFSKSNYKMQSENQVYNQEGQVQARNIYQKSSNSSEGNQRAKKERLFLKKHSSRQIQLTLYSEQHSKAWKKERRRSISQSSLTYKSILSKQKHFSLGKPENLELMRKNTALQQRQGEEDCRIYKNGTWSKTKILILTNRVAFFQCTFFISDLQKIKILPSTNSSKTRNENLIKIQANNQIHLISLGLDRKSYQIPTAYHIFAKLITKKLMREKKAHTQWQRSQHIAKIAMQDSFIYGKILKKSQVLGNWQTRFVVIKKDGIYSYKDSNSEAPHSFYINNSNIKYIWTRFDMQSQYLIIKIKHMVYKTQFAIPITNFQTRTPNNWLYSFYRVMPLLQLSKTNSAQK